MFRLKIVPICGKIRSFRSTGRLFHSLRTLGVASKKGKFNFVTAKNPHDGLYVTTLLSREIHNAEVLHKQEQSTGTGADGDNDDKFTKGSLPLVAITAFGVFAISLYMMFFNEESRKRNIMVTVNEFLEEILPSGEVSQIYVNRNEDMPSVRVRLQRGAVFRGEAVGVMSVSGIKNAEEFIGIVRNAEKNMGINPSDGVSITESNFRSPQISSLLLLLFLYVITFPLLFRRSISVIKGSGKTGKSEAQKMKKIFTTVPNKNIQTNIKFDDVAGCAEAKQEVMEFVHYLKNPGKYQRLGAKMPRGCLLTGPPGVGKTLLAKAVATESDVPFLSKAGSDFVEMIGGLGAKRVRELFGEARSKAPCIVYIDEIDAVGAKRTSSKSSMPTGSSERDQTLNQILVEMDGMLSAEHNVIVMASTNRVDMLDKALLRPGRFDRHIIIDLPTKIERKQIFEQHLKVLKLRKSASNYSERLANLSPGMSGADIANICNEAAICAARVKDPSIDSQHFDQAFERVVGGSVKRSSAITPEERNIVAVHEAGHALVGWMLKHTDALIKVSIIPRTKSPLGFTHTLRRETRLYTRSQLLDMMSMMLAGRAAENLVFGSVTQGAEDDLKKVTNLAYSQVKHLGLNPVIGHLSFPRDEESYVRPYSDALAKTMDNEVKKSVFDAHKRAHDVLESNREKLDILAKELINKEALNYEDIVELIGPPQYGDKTQLQDLDIGSFNPAAV